MLVVVAQGDKDSHESGLASLRRYHPVQVQRVFSQPFHNMLDGTPSLLQQIIDFARQVQANIRCRLLVINRQTPITLEIAS